MARVSDVELERLKRTVSVRRLAEAKGVGLKKSGDDNFLGRCPFHVRIPTMPITDSGPCRSPIPDHRDHPGA